MPQGRQNDFQYHVYLKFPGTCTCIVLCFVICLSLFSPKGLQCIALYKRRCIIIIIIFEVGGRQIVEFENGLLGPAVVLA